MQVFFSNELYNIDTMYHPPTKRKQLLRRIVVYSLMTISVVGIVTILVLITLGYQYNEKDGSIAQGGIVQFDTTPDGATVSVNNSRQGTLTPSKKSLLAGQYFVTMQKNGYQTWQKSVNLTAGSILWLKYARLVPANISTADVADFKKVASSLASPNRKLYVVQESTASPSFKIMNISGETVKTTQLALPAEDFTAPEEGGSQRFELAGWDSTSRYLLIKHLYGDTKTEWIVMDVENVSRSKNVTGELDVAMSQPVFSDKNSRRLYAIIGGDLRRIDLDSSTISAPLARNVDNFNVGSQSTVAYATKPVKGKRSVGYFSDDASKSKIVRTYNDSKPLYASVGTYFDDSYVAIAHGTRLDILMSKGHLPDSDSESQPALNVEATRTLTSSAQYLSVRTGGRFVIAQHGASYTVYDLELEKMTTTKLDGKKTLDKKLRWIDDYIAWSDLTGAIKLYEFDGANQHTIMNVVSGMDATLSADGRYLYGITKSGKTLHLTRAKMIL